MSPQLKVIYMNSKQDIIQDKVYTVRHTLATQVPSSDNGVIHEDTINAAKRSFISYTVGSIADDIIEFKQTYPTKGETEVTFDIDVVVMKRKDYEQLIQDSEY